MVQIRISEEFKVICPQFVGAAIYASVKNSSFNEELWKHINSFTVDYRLNNTLEDIKKNDVIAATRLAYKKAGKDPNRYRPSAEALLRRIMRDIPLYQIDTLVDLINLVSIRTGFSIGGFDVNKIAGNCLELGIGRENEPFEAIGRGMLNIEGLPVYRDEKGGIGTPTSDNERTKVGLDTTSFLALINGYNGKKDLDDAVRYMQMLLEEYVDAHDIEIAYY
jgi:DNA/RNA-binding domain of Phe-tRNA-synthetase-like protein